MYCAVKRLEVPVSNLTIRTGLCKGIIFVHQSGIRGTRQLVKLRDVEILPCVAKTTVLIVAANLIKEQPGFQSTYPVHMNE